MQIILPPEVQHRMALEANLERLAGVRERAGFLKHFDAELKQIDHRLSLVKAREHVTEPGLTPGYWHVKRDNEIGVPSYLVIQGPAGQFMEPHSGVLEDLRRADLQRPGALDEIREREERRERDRRLGLADGQRDRVEEIAGRIKAYDNPGVSMAPGWTYRTSGRRGRA